MLIGFSTTSSSSSPKSIESLVLKILFLFYYYQVCFLAGVTIKANGKVKQYDLSDSSPRVDTGDSILILGKTDSKNIVIAFSITTILYQITIGSYVVLHFF